MLIHQDAESVPFVVEDRTGCCLVRTHQALPDLTVDTTDMADTFSFGSIQVRRFLQRHPGLEPAPSAEVIFEEARLEAGDALAVIGAGHWEINEVPSSPVDQGYREAPQYDKRFIFGGAQLSDDLSCIS